MGPFINDNSVYYANFNRSKYGCTINFKAPEGKEMFKEMVKQADVVIENYRPGTMEKLGLGYDDVLSKINPSLIYGAVSGFGQTGPYSRRAGYDIIGQAMGGMMSTTVSVRKSRSRCSVSFNIIDLNIDISFSLLVLRLWRRCGTLRPYCRRRKSFSGLQGCQVPLSGRPP